MCVSCLSVCLVCSSVCLSGLSVCPSGGNASSSSYVAACLPCYIDPALLCFAFKSQEGRMVFRGKRIKKGREEEESFRTGNRGGPDTHLSLTQKKSISDISMN